MIITFSSVRGAPGVTSWTMLLAAAWPIRQSTSERVVLEADPDGGVLGTRYGFGVDPGAVSLIASLRSAEQIDETVPVEDHARLIGDSMWVVPGPESAERARSVWSASAATVAEALERDDRIWLVDAGRLNATSPAQPFVDHSRMVILLTRADDDSIVQLPSRITTMRERCSTIGAIIVGKSSHSHQEIGDFLDIPWTWMVDEDSDIVQLAGAVLSPGRARRSWLWRTAISVATEVERVARRAAPLKVDDWSIAHLDSGR